MRALILSCPEKGLRPLHESRFSKMISALNEAGAIVGVHYSPQSVKEMQQIVASEQPDIVFSATYTLPEGVPEFTNLHKILEEMQIPYIGSDPDVLELVLSKARLKERWKDCGVPTPEFLRVRRSDPSRPDLNRSIDENGFPYILKPDREGNSRGLSEKSIVFNQRTFETRINSLLGRYDEVLAEKYLGAEADMREFTIAMIGNGEHLLLMPAEIILLKTRTHRIITTADKDGHKTRAILVQDQPLKNRLIRLAESAFQAAGVRDYARCDVIYAAGQLYAIEINGQPMVPDQWFEACAGGMGLNPLQYINAIFLAAIVRNIEQGQFKQTIPAAMKQLLPTPVFDVLTAPTPHQIHYMIKS